MNTKSLFRRSPLSWRCWFALAAAGITLLAPNARAEKTEGGRLIHASETPAAGQKRNQAPRQKLSELGFSD